MALVDTRSKLLVLAALHMCCVTSVSVIGRPGHDELRASGRGFEECVGLFPCTTVLGAYRAMFQLVEAR